MSLRDLIKHQTKRTRDNKRLQALNDMLNPGKVSMCMHCFKAHDDRDYCAEKIALIATLTEDEQFKYVMRAELEAHQREIEEFNERMNSLRKLLAKSKRKSRREVAQ